MNRSILAPLLALCIGLWASPAAAQLQAWDGTSVEEIFGNRVDFIGDIDGDGHDDVVVGRPGAFSPVPWCTGGAPLLSGARVFSGQTGALLYQYSEEVDRHAGSVVRGVGDWDGDGTPDFMLIDEPDYDCLAFAGRARIFSGATGQLLALQSLTKWHDNSYAAGAAAGDVDGDGYADVVLGEPRSWGNTPFSGGRAYIWSGGPAATLSILVEGAFSGQQVGRSVAGVGDWTGDGRGEVAVSTLNSWSRVYHVSSGTILLEVPVAGIVSDAHDHDGDGFRDLLVVRNFEGLIFSGANGALLTTLTGWQNYLSLGDVNGDGIGDYLGSDPTFDGNRGRVGILSGADSSLLSEIRRGTEPGVFVGLAIAVGGDVNADGVGDVLISSRVSSLGRVEAHTGFAPPSPANYCIGAPNSSGPGARMDFTGTWSVSSNHLTLRAEHCPPNNFGVFFFGPTAIQVPFGNGVRCVGGGIRRISPAVSTGATGTAVLPVDLAAHPFNSQIQPGDTRHFQFWFRDIPAGGAQFNLSDALSIRFAP